MNKLSLSRGNSRTELSSLKDLTMIPCFENDKLIIVDLVAILPPRGERESIKELRVTSKNNEAVDLVDLLNSLKNMGYPIENTMIFYYNYNDAMFVNCGKDPLLQITTIPFSQITRVKDRYQVNIVFKRDPNDTMDNTPELNNDKISTKMEFEENSTIPDNEEEMMEEPSEKKEIPEVVEEDSASKRKRTKERMIGEIMEKVIQWRKFYAGYKDPETGEFVKLSLEESADKVGISKKSLDDYLLQIRFGKKCGFNFKEHLDDRVGVLRAFVKKNKHVMHVEKTKKDEFDLASEFSDLLEKKEPKMKQKKSENLQANIGLSTRSKKIAK